MLPQVWRTSLLTHMWVVWQLSHRENIMKMMQKMENRLYRIKFATPRRYAITANCFAGNHCLYMKYLTNNFHDLCTCFECVALRKLSKKRLFSCFSVVFRRFLLFFRCNSFWAGRIVDLMRADCSHGSGTPWTTTKRKKNRGVWARAGLTTFFSMFVRHILRRHQATCTPK